ncbi:MAG: ankyrin repeat domain-containing protein [Pirellulaceae bacterium]
MERRFQYRLRTLAVVIVLAALVFAIRPLFVKQPYDIGFRSGIAPARALAMAAFEGDSRTMRALLRDPKIDVNEQDELDRTALHWAAYRGCEDCVQLLLDQDAAADVLDFGGQTAADIARIRGYARIAAILNGAPAASEQPTPIDGTIAGPSSNGPTKP